MIPWRNQQWRNVRSSSDLRNIGSSNRHIPKRIRKQNEYNNIMRTEYVAYERRWTRCVRSKDGSMMKSSAYVRRYECHRWRLCTRRWIQKRCITVTHQYHRHYWRHWRHYSRPAEMVTTRRLRYLVPATLRLGHKQFTLIDTDNLQTKTICALVAVMLDKDGGPILDTKIGVEGRLYRV